MKGSLHQETIRLMKERSQTLIEISQATGIPFYWLRKIEEFEDPSVNRIQRLYEYLSGRQLVTEDSK